VDDILTVSVHVDLLNVIRDITYGVYDHTSVIFNETNYTTMDISSGALNKQKTKKADLFQFQSILLDGGKQFLESFEIGCSKEGGNLSVNLKINVMTIDIILTKSTGNSAPISLDATC